MRASVQRPTIEHLLKRGMRSSDVVRTLGISDSTVRNISAALKKYGSSSERSKTRRPQTVNTRRIRGVIKRRIDRIDGLSLNNVAGDLKIGGRTAQRILKDDLKVDSYKLARGQYLSDTSKPNRIDKAKKLLAHFRVRRVSDVIWSDEKIFTIEPLPNRQNQRHLLCKGDNKSPKRRQVSNRLFPKSVMVWTGVTSTGKTLLVFIDRNVKIDAEVYQKDSSDE
uniref:Transposase IS30-like HTH domain-containing protein n=1 Tax=Caenorhabditis japonica TaxID=281687 RepID=A0A8R1EKK0_CAEJA